MPEPETCTTKTDKVEERGGEFFVLSESGEELSGPFSTEEQANERLRQIEAAKAARGKTGDSVPQALVDSAGTAVRRFDFNLGALHTDAERSDGILMHEDKTTGFLRGEARMARTGVQQYGDAEGNVWGEYRDASEVFSEDSLRSYDLAVVTDDHPAQFVTLKNREAVDKGAVGTDARPDSGKFVRASLVVRDADTIRAIKAGKRDLSMGYTATVLVSPGVTEDGIPFAGRQTNIRINHAAIVDKGRAGPECGVELARGDAFTITTEVTLMKTKKIKLADGTEHVVPIEVADAYVAAQNLVSVTVDGETCLVPKLVADAMDAKGSKAPPFGKKPEEEEEGGDDEAAKSGDSDSSLRAKVDMLETKAAEDADTFNARVDARSKLVTDARDVLGRDYKTDGVNDAALMRSIVLKVSPRMETKLDANKGDAGYLRCAYDEAMDLHARRDAAERDTGTTIFDAMNDGAEGGDAFLDALKHYNKRADRAIEAMGAAE